MGGVRYAGPESLQLPLGSRRVPQARLLAWVARLRYLHAACSHPLLQSIVLSVWGSRNWMCPPLTELIERFSVTVTNADAGNTLRTLFHKP